MHKSKYVYLYPVGVLTTKQQSKRIEICIRLRMSKKKKKKKNTPSPFKNHLKKIFIVELYCSLLKGAYLMINKYVRFGIIIP